jgi:hypothetical protein
MAEEGNRSYPIPAGEKISSIMAYTMNLLVWGEVLTKEAIRASTWLRTPAIPQYIFIHDAQVMNFAGSSLPKPVFFRELHLPSSQVIAFHIKPPTFDPLDYDPNEPMRKMEPATALVGTFRFDGFLRMSTQTSIDRFLDVSKETFTALYDLEITQPLIPSMKPIRVPFALLRSDFVLFSPRATA